MKSVNYAADMVMGARMDESGQGSENNQDGLPQQVTRRQGRVDGHNSEWKSGKTRVPKPLKYEIEMVLKEHRDKAARKDKKVGAGTQDKRGTVIHNFFSDLYYLKFKLKSIHSLKQKHLVAVFNFLEDQGQLPSTIQNKISIMRVFCEWIGKHGMVRDCEEYVKDQGSVRRSTVVQEDMSWEAKGIDVAAKTEEIRREDPVVAIQMELCFAFGLRVKEAVTFIPKVSHEIEQEYVFLREGTKGDRSRVVPIENAVRYVQLDVLTRAKAMADEHTGFLGVRGKTVKQKIRRLHYVMEKCGITLAKDGITPHGARHQYMHESFKRLTGIDAPIKGGDISVLTLEQFDTVSRKLAERAGHTRPTIGAAYYGSRDRRPRQIRLGGGAVEPKSAGGAQDSGANKNEQIGAATTEKSAS